MTLSFPTVVSSNPTTFRSLDHFFVALATPPGWQKTVGYAGIEHAGVLRQAEIGLLSDGTYGARTAVHEKAGTYRLYKAADLRLTEREARNVETVKRRVREFIDPKVAAISLPMSSIAPDSKSPVWDVGQASLVTQKVMHDVRSKMMPGTGLWLKAFDRHLSGPYDRFVKAQENLETAIARERGSSGTASLRNDLGSVTAQAILATNDYLRAGGRAFEAAARVQVKELANLSRDMSVSAGTALGGPLGGLSIAGLTRYQDVAQPGPRMYTTSGMEDAISILSTTGALKAGDAAESLAHGKKAQIAWDATLHWIADVVPEAAGQAFKSWLHQKPLDKIRRDALAAGAAASGPSLVNSVATAVMEKVFKIDRGQTIAIGEALEKMATRSLIYYAVGKDDRVQPFKVANAGRSPGGLSLFDLLYTEAKHNAPLYGPLPGMNFLRRLQSAAAGCGNPAALPPGGVLRQEGDVTVALLVVMAGKKNLAERQTLIKYLTQ